MPLSSRANTHPKASRLNDFGAGASFLPGLLLRKNQSNSSTDSPPKKLSTPPRKVSPPRHEKHEKRQAFFAKQHLRRKKKMDEAPLLSDLDEEELQITRSFGSVRSSVGSCKRVMDLAPVPEMQLEGETKQRLVMPSYIESPPKLRTRNSDRSYATAITASSSGSTSSGDHDHSLMTISPPCSPNANRGIVSRPDLPYVEEEEDVKIVDVDGWNAFMRHFESDDLMSLSTIGGQNRGKNEDDKSISSNSTQSSFLANPTDAFIKLVEDCEARWNSYTESLREWSLMPVLARASDDDTVSTERVADREKPEQDDSFLQLTEYSEADDSFRRLTDYRGARAMHEIQIVQGPQEKEEVELVVSREAEIIRAQQEEIDYLRAQLLRQQELLIREEAAFSSFRPNTWEQIDTIPMEEIEVTIDNNDALSIGSALTNLNDSSTKFNDDSTAILATIPPTRPDAASVVDNDAVVPSKWVKNFPIKLQAANGHVRSATYTGPSVGGVFSGVATLRFETGDEYMGEVVNGKMHGHGTYTFAKNKEGREKVLRGLFENNVYMGWNPAAMRRAEF